MPVLTPQQHEKEMHSAASSGNWDKAIEHAKLQPKNWSAFDKLPQYNIPPEAFEKVINAVPKSERPSFYFELASNLHPDLSHDQLDLLGSKTGDDSYVQKRVQSHPNWNPRESKKNLSEKVASDFWLSYERRVEPHHFAVIKSLISGKPEEITDHRGKTGHSHLGSIQNGRLYEKETNLAPNGPRFYGEQFLANLKDVHPHILNHAKKVQDAILQDENIEKKTINGKPHIKLYRGLGGSYSKRIAKASKYDPKDHSVENKRFKVKSAPFSSWSTEKEIADTFAKRRSESIGVPGPAKPGESVTVSSWIPVENILHSGFHRVHTGQEHAHPQEYEIIVSHPTGYMNLDSKDLHFIDTAKDPYSSETKNVSIKRSKPQKLAASEKEYFTDLLEKSFKSKIATAALGASLLSTPISAEPKQKAYKEESVMLHPDLVSISAIESNYGKNKQHKKVLHGVNLGHTAAGATGLMPLTVKETIKRNKDLANRYPQAISMNHDDLTDFINKNPNVENKIANAHYNRLLKIFKNDKNRAAYAWRNGISAAKTKSDNEIASDPYIKAVRKINKSENYLYFEKLKKTVAEKINKASITEMQNKTPKVLISPEDMAQKIKEDASKLKAIEDNIVFKKQTEINKRFHLDENQLKLINKINFDSVEPAETGQTVEKNLKTGKTKNSFGENIFIKQNDPLGSFSMQDPKISVAQRELLYYDLANKVFKTGNNVPLTSLAHDGKSVYSVQKYLDGYSEEKFPENHVPSNVLQILALQDSILGNGDRHTSNYLIKPADKNGPANIMLIDNGYMMDYEQKNKFFTQRLDLYDKDKNLIYKAGTKIPYSRIIDSGIENMDLYDQNGELYRKAGDLGRWVPAYLSKENSKSPLKEEVKKWLNNIDINAAQQIFKNYGVSDEAINKFKTRIKKAKRYSKYSNITLADLLFKIDGMHKLARHRKKATQSKKEYKNSDLGSRGFLQNEVVNKFELVKSYDRYFSQKLNKIDGLITTTTMPAKTTLQTGPSLNGTSSKEQPRGTKGDTNAAQQISQSFQGNLGMPAVRGMAQRIKGFFR